jgi:Type I phosphodiesterase / nucleotide pyrophosphatase
MGQDQKSNHSMQLLSQTTTVLPDYHGNSIVNLMSSVVQARGGAPGPYAPLNDLPPSAIADARNLVLMVVDGLGFNHLTRLCSGSTLHRYLRARVTSVFPSTTASAITTFMTGLAPQQHGLTGWFMYFKEVGALSAVLPFRTRSGQASLRDLGTTPAQLFKHTPVFDLLDCESYVVSPQRIVDSDFNAFHSGRAARVGYRALQDFFAAVEGIVRRGTQRKYVYAYYPELDTLAHMHGINSTQVASQFAAFDGAFAQCLSALAGTDTALVVIADHGFIDCKASEFIQLERHPGLAQTLVLPLCGEPRVAYCYVHATRAPEFEEQVANSLGSAATLLPSAALIEQGYFGPSAPHPQLRERIGDYVLLMQGNYALKDWVAGERKHAQIGVHGGLSADEMYVPLIVAHV